MRDLMQGLFTHLLPFGREVENFPQTSEIPRKNFGVGDSLRETTGLNVFSRQTSGEGDLQGLEGA